MTLGWRRLIRVRGLTVKFFDGHDSKTVDSDTSQSNGQNVSIVKSNSSLVRFDSKCKLQ